MATPVANFDLTPNYLVVQFLDTSLNTPTSWAWNFGDGASGGANTSALANPTHTFTVTGSYVVTLISTNASGSNTKTLTINVSSSIILPLSIKEMVKRRIPGSMTVDPLLINTYVAEYQIYLAPLLDPVIPDANLYNESAWPALGNALVAELVSYHITIDTVNNLVLALSNTSSNTSTASSGSLKKLVTGPSEAEWWDSTQTTTDFLSSTFKSGSGFEQSSLNVICSLAKRLNISLPECVNTKKFPRPFIVVK